jgi:hypothetical protein
MFSHIHVKVDGPTRSFVEFFFCFLLFSYQLLMEEATRVVRTRDCSYWLLSLTTNRNRLR